MNFIPCVIDVKQSGDVEAILEVDGKMSTGTAHCLEPDTYDRNVGAVIAFSKALAGGMKEGFALLDMASTAVKSFSERRKFPGCETVTKVPVTPKHTKGSPIARKFRKDYTLVSDYGSAFYGTLGDATMYRDCNGKSLRVGDLVEISWRNPANGKSKVFDGFYYVLDEEGYGQFIDSIKGVCDPADGHIRSDYKVRRVKNWYELRVEESHNETVVIWRGEE